MRSYRTVSPLPPLVRRPGVAVCSLWHFPASHLGLPLAITLLCEVRTFLEPPRPYPCPVWCGPRPPGQLIRPDNVAPAAAIPETNAFGDEARSRGPLQVSTQLDAQFHDVDAEPAFDGAVAASYRWSGEWLSLIHI